MAFTDKGKNTLMISLLPNIHRILVNDSVDIFNFADLYVTENKLIVEFDLPESIRTITSIQVFDRSDRQAISSARFPGQPVENKRVKYLWEVGG